MANQWALLIGINQYESLQPLMYAQSDAVALRNFFVDELGIPVENCTLLTDISAAIEPYARTPLKADIETSLKTLCRDKMQPGDVLWIFFSGCGLTEGGKDYWMTLESDPKHPSKTAIALADVFDILADAKTDQVLLVADMNRNQGAIGHHDIGAQTLTLGKDFGKTVFLSCQPDQYAHETMYIRHGLFTKALLEGLRYHGCITASQLGTYVSDRVPELCEHHCRPVQNPAIAIPPEQKFMMVVPPSGIASLSMTEAAAANITSDPAYGGAAVAGGRNQTFAGAPTATQSRLDSTVSPSAPIQRPTAPPSGTDSFVTGSGDGDPKLRIVPTDIDSDEPSRSGAIVHRRDRADSSEQSGSFGWLWKGGILAIVVAFLAGVLLRYQPALLGGSDESDTATVESVEGTEASDAEVAPANADAEDTASSDTNTGESLFPEEVDPIAAGESALQRAEAAIAAGRYGEARAWLDQVPAELQDETYQSLLQQTTSEVAEAATRNQDILNSARQIIQPASASLFNDAIEQARQVPPEDPYYEQAQADIARWSQVILDLAEGRAASGDISGAIAAAGLVPDDQPAIYESAQQRIATWQSQIDNQQLILQTQNSLQPGQASSFNDAIEALRQITPDQAVYETAQARINQWSQDILAIARARAAQGDISGAIAAAELVPEDTEAYTQAQQEIQRWQTQL